MGNMDCYNRWISWFQWRQPNGATAFKFSLKFSTCYVIHFQDTSDPNNLSITIYGIAYNGTSNVRIRKLTVDTSSVYQGDNSIWGTGLAIGKA